MADATLGDLRYIILAAIMNVSSMFFYFVLFSAQPRWRYANRFDKTVSVLLLGASLGNLPTLIWMGWAVCQPQVKTSPPWAPGWIVLFLLFSFIAGLAITVPTAARYAMPDYSFLVTASNMAAIGAIEMLADIDGQHRTNGVCGITMCLLMLVALVGSLICHQIPSLPRISRHMSRTPAP